MKRFTLFLCLLFLSFSSLAFDHNCDSGGACGSSKVSLDLSEKHKVKIEELLTEIYDILGRQYEIGATKRYVESWYDYIEKACSLVGISTNSGGSWPTAHALACIEEQLEKRVGVLKQAVSCMKAMTSLEIGEGAVRISCMKDTLNINIK